MPVMAGGDGPDEKRRRLGNYVWIALGILAIIAWASWWAERP
jgi:hypothetical protein